MKTVRKYIDANRLMTVLSLPDTFKDQRLEVIIRPVQKQAEEETDKESVVQSLIGAIPYTDLSLSELREERLKACGGEFCQKIGKIVKTGVDRGERMWYDNGVAVILVFWGTSPEI